MILKKNIWMLLFDTTSQLTKEYWLPNTCHIFQAKFLCTSCDFFVSQLCIIVQSVNRRGSDTERTLWSHTTFLCPFQGWSNVTNIIQTVKKTSNIYTLSVLYAIHHRTNIIRYRIHTQCIQTAIKHVSLDTSFMQNLCIGTY